MPVPATPDPYADPLAFGQRLRILRTRRGVTRDQLGGLVARGGAWVKALETGRLGIPRFDLVLRLAEVLRVRDLTELTGDPSVPVPLFAGPGHPRLAAVRAAVDRLTFAGDREAPPTAQLTARLERAWAARHASAHHREVIGARLPELIHDAQLTVRQAASAVERRAAQSALSESYSLAQFFLAYQPDAALLWRVAERGLVAAQESEHPHTIGVAAWLSAQAHRDAGPPHSDAADAVTTATLSYLEPLLPDASPDLIAITGALTFEAGHTAARRTDTGTAWRSWDRAREIASRLPEGYFHPVTSFGRAVMAAHAVTLAVELRQGGEAVRQSAASDATPIPSRPRTARHRIEEARGYHLDGQPDVALAVLERAHERAPETIAYNGYAKAIVLEEAQSKHAARRRRASTLAVTLGLLAA
ncbi:helix-turn-helix domain-containing protein [Streptomyces sp. NPDC057638]|uniref:helix-turn-helix domain-containing protein n=1 Tax=Streptomyces sp. NPDC057638 TaxID=3346190 RepID=UPI00368A814D